MAPRLFDEYRPPTVRPSPESSVVAARDMSGNVAPISVVGTIMTRKARSIWITKKIAGGGCICRSTKNWMAGSALTSTRLKMPKAPMPFFVRPIIRGVADRVTNSFVDPQLKLHFDYMEAELGRNAWFAGDEFSAADIQMSFPIEAGKARGLVDARRPNLANFLERIHGRPAYQRALEEGGEFAVFD